MNRTCHYRGAVWVGALLVVSASHSVATAQPKSESPTALIDRVLAAAWKENKLTPPGRMTDEQFLRRVTLDVVGRQPTPVEMAAFVKEKAADKRSRVVDQLLAGPEYAAHWGGVWTGWLLPADYRPAYKEQTRKWLEGQFAKGASYLSVVTELIAATGKTTENGAVHFVLSRLGNQLPEDLWTERGQFEAVPVTAETARLFLGRRGECIVCHDHPFDKDLRQRQFWGLNVFFRQVERIGEPCADSSVVSVQELTDNPKFHKDGTVRFKRRSGLADATGMSFLDGRNPRLKGDVSRRMLLAEMVVRHPDFGPVAVNRVWAHLLGRSLLEWGGLDDFSEANDPLYPDLLGGVVKAFAEGGYDQRKLIAWICKSEVYQLQPTAGAIDPQDRYFLRTRK